jgi:hypothetical protein
MYVWPRPCHSLDAGDVPMTAWLMVLVLWPAWLSAATYYVSPDGADSASGSEAAPFRTLNHGVKGLQPGDTLLINSGTYAEALRNVIPGGTSWSAPVTVAAAPGQTVTLKPPAGTDMILYFAGATRQYIIVDGLILDGTHITVSGIVIGHEGMHPADSAHHLRIINTEVKSIPKTGIDVRKGADFNEFVRLRVHDTGLSGTGHGLYIHSNANVGERSRIYHNGKCGIQFFDLDGGVHHNVFRYNQVYDNGKGSQGGQFDTACRAGLWVGAGTGTRVYNNVIWGNALFGVVVGPGASKAQIAHNTLSANGALGLVVQGGAHGMRSKIILSLRMARDRNWRRAARP